MLIVACQASVAVASGPGVDEYNLHIPGAGNSDNQPTPGDVQSDPSALPPATATELAQSPDGALLGAIATSPELGAPSHKGGGDEGAGASSATHGIGPALSQLAAGNEGRSVPSSLASAAGDQSSLPLILAVAAITAVAAGFVVRRRRSILDG